MEQLSDIVLHFTFERTLLHCNFLNCHINFMIEITVPEKRFWALAWLLGQGLKITYSKCIEWLPLWHLHVESFMWQDNGVFHQASRVSVGDAVLGLWGCVLGSDPGRELDFWSHVVQGGVGIFCTYSHGYWWGLTSSTWIKILNNLWYYIYI